MREAVRGTARPTPLANTVTAGEPMRRVVHSSQQVTNARLTPPGGGEPQSLAAVPLAEDAGRSRTRRSRSPSPTRAGRACTASPGTKGPWARSRISYAANPDPRESDLERIAATELKTMLEPLDVEIAAARGDVAGLFSPTGREIWRDLAVSLCSLLLIVESLFATWVGRSR